jgi:glycosyltransferase involved in cell wall biosynthesis
MRVSVITITYNAEATLEKTMLSVLNQSCHDYEYLIVDGASTDGTLALIRQYEARVAQGEFGIAPEQFRWQSEPDHGLYDAMNKGMERAQGDFVWFINSGDKIYDETTLQRIVEALNEAPDADVVYGQSIIVDPDDRVLGERHRIAPAQLTKRSLLDGLVVCHQSILARRSKAPRYDLQYKLTADYDWVCRLLEVSGRNLYVDAYLSRFMSAGLSSQKRKQSLKERFVIMRRQFGLFPTLWSHLRILLKYPFVTRKHVY